MLHHVNLWFGGLPGDWSRGGLSVDLFFVISGYVMARTYEERLISGRMSPGRFLLIRYRRLLPIYAVGAALGASYLAFGGVGPLEVALALGLALLFLPAPFIDNSFSPSSNRMFTVNNPGWSLFFEIAANAVHGAMLARVRTRVLAATWMVMLVFLTASITQTGWVQALASDADWLPTSLRVATSYCAGILIFRVNAARLPIPGALALPVFLAAIVLGGFFSPPAFSVLFVAALSPAIVIAAIRWQAPAAWSALGALSYPLYATHGPVVQIGARLGLPPPLLLVLALAVATVLTFAIELRRGSSRSRPKPNPEAESDIPGEVSSIVART